MSDHQKDIDTMKIMKKYLAHLLLILMGAACFGAGSLYAIDDKAGTGAGAFMKLGLGCPRAQALGRAYTALAEGGEALAWNPAGIALSQQREAYFSHLSWLGDYSGNYLAYIQPIGQTVIGANFAYLSMNGFDVRDANNIPQPSDSVDVQHGFATLAVSRAFFTEHLALGASAKRISENNDGDEYTNLVFDFGAKLRMGRILSLGWAMQNVGNSDEVVQVTRYGAAVNLTSYVTVSGELEQPTDNRRRLGMGLEIHLPEELLQVGRFSLRLGYYDSDDHGKNYDDDFLKRFSLDQTSKVSFGFGLYTSEVFGYGVGLDYAMVPYGALGKTSQIALRFQF